MTAKNERSGTKRLHISLPNELYDELQAFADQKHTTVVDVLRRFIHLGLVVSRAEDDPNMALVIRDGDREREVFLI